MNDIAGGACVKSISRWDRISKGMSFDEVKKIFGNDIWQNQGFGTHTWLVNNESDHSPDHGYMITFDTNMVVTSKGTISISG